jgi:hypothetical protein
MVSAEASVMRQPSATYARLAQHVDARGLWLALRRPLFSVFLFGAVLSLAVTGRLTARLIAGGAVGWSFIPLFEVASFAVVRSRAGRRASFSRDLDVFLAGNGPWLVSLIAFGSIAAFVTPLAAYALSGTRMGDVCVSLAAGAIAVWCGYIDYCFFRVFLERPPRSAVVDLVLQRAICWTAVAVYFGGYAGWPLVADKLGL